MYERSTFWEGNSFWEINTSLKVWNLLQASRQVEIQGFRVLIGWDVSEHLLKSKLTGSNSGVLSFVCYYLMLGFFFRLRLSPWSIFTVLIWTLIFAKVMKKEITLPILLHMFQWSPKHLLFVIKATHSKQ